MDWRPGPVRVGCPHGGGEGEAEGHGRVGTLATSPPLTDLACGSEHTVALLRCGCVAAWGWNEHGNLGTGDTVTRHRPVTAWDARGGQRGLAVAAGGAISLVACEA